MNKPRDGGSTRFPLWSLGWSGWVIILWLASLVLLLWNIGNLPLRDWDESLVARVALEMSERPWLQNLIPTMWHQPYLNKPPFLHGLIAAVIALWRTVLPGAALISPPPEWLVRLVPALLSSLVVPLVALIQARLRPGDRMAAVASASVALTLLPLMRHGRLAMLDGTLISAMTLQWWALLSIARQPSAADLRLWGLLAGLGTSVILLLKAPVAIPLLVGSCVLLALEMRWTLGLWKRLLSWIGAGILPGLLWHAWHGWVRGEAALHMWGAQGFARVISTVQRHDLPVLVPLKQVIRGGWPWLALWPFAIFLAWQQRRSRWGYWILGLTLLTACLVLPLRTQLPWYSHLLWPSFVLAVSPLFASLMNGLMSPNSGFNRAVLCVPVIWFLAGSFIVLVPSALRDVPRFFSSLSGAAVGIGGALLLAPSLQLRRIGGFVLVLLLWCAMMALFSGPHWMWLGKVKNNWDAPHQLAALIQHLPAEERSLRLILEDRPSPSIAWYLGHNNIEHGNISDVLGKTAQQAVLVASRSDPSSVPGWSCVRKSNRARVENLFVCNRI
jgi:4-amino-4-deoxy-L-arabinose transferase-like glycosyltransferase